MLHYCRKMYFSICLPRDYTLVTTCCSCLTFSHSISRCESERIL